MELNNHAMFRAEPDYEPRHCWRDLGVQDGLDRFEILLADTKHEAELGKIADSVQRKSRLIQGGSDSGDVSQFAVMKQLLH